MLQLIFFYFLQSFSNLKTFHDLNLGEANTMSLRLVRVSMPVTMDKTAHRRYLESQKVQNSTNESDWSKEFKGDVMVSPRMHQSIDKYAKDGRPGVV